MGEKYSHGGQREPPTNRRRRLVLSQLQSHGPMTIRDLAEQIAVTDQETCIESLCEEAIEEVEIALHHVHVPKLEQIGYVNYDERNRIVGPTEQGREFDVEIGCEEVSSDAADHISIDLCGDTLDRLHEIIREDERFEARMSYNEVIAAILSDVELEEKEAQ